MLVILERFLQIFHQVIGNMTKTFPPWLNITKMLGIDILYSNALERIYIKYSLYNFHILDPQKLHIFVLN